ncbi:MAG: sigma-70 family RNA polymerase sigma factor [Gemmatimonadaceae bacterium]|nr:sigma-70 family RNA polymerase sigma factor [Gemmatimonadaceae bacterium]
MSLSSEAADPAHVGPTIERLLIRFGDVVRRAGAKYGLDRDDLDEVLQEVRIRLWRQGGATDGDGEAKLTTLTPAYIYRAASSAALDLLRRRRSEKQRSTGGLEAPPHLPAGAGADDRLYTRESLAAIEAAIDALAPARRPVVRMYLTGYPREEIASLLGWSDDKVRNLLYRGLEDLRQRLAAGGMRP